MPLSPTDTRLIKPLSGGSPVRPADTPGVGGLMTLMVGVVVLAGLYLGKDLLIPIVFAVLISFVLSPVVNFLRRIGLPRILAVVLATLTALLAAAALATVLGLQVVALVSDIPRYRTTIERKVDALNNGVVGRLAKQLSGFSRQIEEAAAPETPAAAADEPGESTDHPMIVQVQDKPLGNWGVVTTYGTKIAGPLTEAAIVFVVVIFILMQRADLRDRMIRLFGSNDLHKTTAAMDDAAKRLARFFLLQLALATLYGCAATAVLWFIGVPAPVLWGVLAGLMRFVPYVGSVVALVPPVLLAAAVDPGWSLAIWVLVSLLVMEGLQGHVVEPLVYGTSTGLSPVAVIISAVFWTWLWGPVGLLLATPLTLLLVVLGRHVERLEFLDVILGDRPALSPEENFYQRTLAGDADELVDHAEQLMKDRSLSSYYDEVAIKGLQIAARDRARGVLTDEQVELVRRTISDLVEELDERDDVDPPKAEAANGNGPVSPPAEEKPKEPGAVADPVPPDAIPDSWKDPGSVLCVAGRGRLDEGAAMMLAQLLEKHGIGARVLSRDEVSRAAIASLDVAGVKMICISYLEVSTHPAHVRGLVQRLKRRAHGVPVMLGLWPEGDAILNDSALQSRVGAGYFVTSLRGAVESCIFHATAAERLGQVVAPAAAE